MSELLSGYPNDRRINSKGRARSGSNLVVYQAAKVLGNVVERILDSSSESSDNNLNRRKYENERNYASESYLPEDSRERRGSVLAEIHRQKSEDNLSKMFVKTLHKKNVFIPLSLMDIIKLELIKIRPSENIIGKTFFV